MTVLTIGQLAGALLAANFVARPLVTAAVTGVQEKFNLFSRQNKDGTTDSLALPARENKKAESHDIKLVAEALGLTPKEFVKTLSILAVCLVSLHATTGGIEFVNNDRLVFSA